MTRLTAYKRELEKMKLTQLDVYRMKSNDIIRVKTAKGEVKLIELPRHREEMTVEEFREYVKQRLES